MKKQNIALLCIAPFVIALFGIAAIQETFALNASDITGINWDYKDTEAFQISDNKYKLSASAVSSSRYALAAGNNLVWTVSNLDAADTNVYASVSEENGNYYLTAVKEGKVVVKVANAKGSIFKSMTGIIYKDCAVVVNPVILSSQSNIDPMTYYGQYDLVNGVKTPAKVSYNVSVFPDTMESLLIIKDISSNSSFDLSSETLSFSGTGKGHFTLGLSAGGLALDSEVDYSIVEDGINIFTYQDLLYCTNKSAQGEKAVLRTSFGSLKDTYYLNSDGTPLKSGDTYRTKASNMALFGTYDEKTKGFDFKDEIYSFTTLSDKEYIDQWNAFAKNNSSYSPITDQVKAGLRIQKDFYGNGYTLDMHNLTYPYAEKQVTLTDGSTAYVPTLTEDNLFRGPLPFYALGDPNKLDLVEAYGEDNTAVLLDGDNITFDDVNLKSCDYDGSLSYLDTVGTVMDLKGTGLKVRNSRLQNGKNIIRAFSSEVTIDNCLIAHARNFLVECGSNRYIKTDGTAIKAFIKEDGTSASEIMSSYFEPKNTNGADGTLNKFLSADFTSKENMKKALESIQDSLNDTSKIQGVYDGNIVIKDTFFADSGISSIAMESLFNGPYLYSGVPSAVTELLGSVSQGSNPLVPFVPKGISGVNYPVKLSLTGKTRFYDYKKTSDLDLSGLIKENISVIANSILNSERVITIDDIFPMKSILFSQARSAGCVYNGTVSGSSSEYINIPVAFYGGGANLSTVDLTGLTDTGFSSSELTADMLNSYLSLPKGDTTTQMMKNMALKTVTTVTGFSPFRFDCLKGNGYLFGSDPDTQELINNAKGA
jgi:hypothetical protein